MRRTPITRLATLTLLAAAALIPATVFFSAATLAQSEKDDPAPAADAGKAADADKEEAIQAPTAPEPERISGTIYKVDPAGKVVGVLVQLKPSRAYKRYKLVMDDKSLILVGGQPSDLTALSEGQAVEVGYWKKGKQEVIDSIVVSN